MWSFAKPERKTIGSPGKVGKNPKEIKFAMRSTHLDLHTLPSNVQKSFSNVTALHRVANSGRSAADISVLFFQSWC